MKGLVVAVKYGVYSVQTENALFNVPARGKFKRQDLRVTVGDYVELNEIDLVIDEVYPRTSFLIRPLIANIDQALVVLSLKEPTFSSLLALKYLTYINMNGLSSYLLLTKADNEEDIKEGNRIKSNFESIGVKTILISNKTGLGLDEVQSLFKGHISCLMGQSGVGKSSLLNNVDKNYKRDIGEYSMALGRGKHQTKEVILLPYLEGYIADTPGFSSLDLNLKKNELAKFFPGFSNLSTECYFSNCLHQNEKKCKVKEHLDKGEIPAIIYESYLKLLEESER